MTELSDDMQGSTPLEVILGVVIPALVIAGIIAAVVLALLRKKCQHRSSNSGNGEGVNSKVHNIIALYSYCLRLSLMLVIAISYIVVVECLKLGTYVPVWKSTLHR